LLGQMHLTRAGEIVATAKRLISYIDAGHYKAGCDATGVPQKDASASFEREASSNFRLSPAQGDPWDQPSIHVPAHRGPFPNFTAAQIDAYHLDGLDKIGLANWIWERSCYEWELFNGFGYRAHGVHSPYLWAGSNIYTGGKYVADGVWSASAIDSQLGVIPIMFQIAALRPDLALPLPFPGTTNVVSTPPVVDPPMPAPEGLQDAAALQNALNKLGADPVLVVDDSYGRQTKRAVEAFQQSAGITVDGLAGPETWAAIDAKLAAAK
jgi:lysozyme family protein